MYLMSMNFLEPRSSSSRMAGNAKNTDLYFYIWSFQYAGRFVGGACYKYFFLYFSLGGVVCTIYFFFFFVLKTRRLKGRCVLILSCLILPFVEDAVGEQKPLLSSEMQYSNTNLLEHERPPFAQ